MSIVKIFSLCAVLCSSMAMAKDHTVKLLTQGSDGKVMVFEPIFIKIAKGDSINFVPADVSHNAESFSTPSPASAFKTPYGKPTRISFNEEGAVLVKCLPHFPLGMISVIQVGDNIDNTKVKTEWEKAKASVMMNKEAIDHAINQIK